MNAMELLHHIQNKGVNLVLLDANNIKAHPASVINDDTRKVIRANKLNLIAALKHEHFVRKAALRQGRLIVLRNDISRFLYGNAVGVVNLDEVERYIDRALVDYNYDLEQIIDYYRSLAPPLPLFDPRCQCGYLAPFCVCRVKNKVNSIGLQ